MPADSVSLAGAFLIGLGLNLTPCVYPLLSITVSLFANTKEPHPLGAFTKALVYVLGIATMYSGLGLAAALTGEIFGAFLQNRFVLLTIALFLFLIALSMLGVYTFRLPAWLTSKLPTTRKTSLPSLYLSGLFVGIFAAPCIGPPVIALLTFVGTKGDPLFAFWIFFIMSLGLGIPYLILGTFSGLLQKLPKSGMWLVWVERLFGVVLVGLAGFYFMIAVNPDYLRWLVPTMLLAGGIYLGFIERSPQYPPAFVYFKQAAGIFAVIVGLALPFMEARPGVTWEPYSPEKLEFAKENSRPVIIDFYADWCIPCHELDRYTYSNPEVIKALENFIRLKVDLTRPDAAEAEEIIEKFKVVGVPTILFLDREGSEVKDSRITGFVPPKAFLGILELYEAG